MEEQKTFIDHCKDGWDRNKKKIGVAVGVIRQIIRGWNLQIIRETIVRINGGNQQIAALFAAARSHYLRLGEKTSDIAGTSTRDSRRNPSLFGPSENFV